MLANPAASRDAVGKRLLFPAELDASALYTPATGDFIAVMEELDSILRGAKRQSHCSAMREG